MDKQQLKPCPFCGGEAEIKQYRSDGIRIRCRACSVKIEQRCMRLTLDQLEELMIADWNKRMPQPPSASDERERFEAWQEKEAPGADLAHCGSLIADGPARESYRNMYVAERWIGWQARAALAPSPGVDAFPSSGDNAWKDLFWQVADILNCLPSTFVDGNEHVLKAAARAMSAPSPAASAEWLAEAERLVDAFFLAGSSEPRSFNATESARAALLAHLKDRPAPADECQWLGHTATSCPGGPKCDLLKKGDE